MKRPLTAFGFTMLIASFVMCRFGNIKLCFIVMSIAFGGLVFSLLMKKTRKIILIPTILISVIFSCFVFLGSEYNLIKSEDFSSDRQLIYGTVQSPPEYKEENGRYYLLLETKTIDGEKIKTKLRLSFSVEKDNIDINSFNPGDKVSFTAYVYKIGGDDREIRNYFKSKGIFLGAYTAKNFEVEKMQRHGYLYYSNELREYIKNTLLSAFGEEKGGVLLSMLTGDKSLVKDEIYSAFQKSGVAHLMAVSGFHLTVWIMLISKILSLFSFDRKKSSFALMAVVLFVMVTAGFSSSVMRAGFMMLLYLSAPLFSRESDGLNSLGFATVVIILLNQYSCLDVGFLLSFLSTLAILILGFPESDKLIRKAHKKLSENKNQLINNKAFRYVLSAVMSNLSVSVSVFIFTFPVMLLSFGGISTVGIITNLLFLPVAFPLIISSGLFCILKSVPVISLILKFIAKILCIYSIKVVTVISSFRYSYISLNYDYLKFWLIFAVIVTISAFAFKKYAPKFVKPLIALIVLSFIFGGYYEMYHSFDSYKITAVDSGKGVCTIVSMDGHGVLIGGNGNYYLKSAVEEAVNYLSINIDAVILGDNDDKKIIKTATDCENICYYANMDSAITLFDKVSVTSDKKGTVTVSGNKIKTKIILAGGLQEDYGCDIIITDNEEMKNFDGVVIFTGDAKEEKFSTEKLDNITVTIDKNGKYKLRGENSWLSLMKSN